MSDYCLEIAEYMHEKYKEVPVDTWQYLLVQGPIVISQAIESYYCICRGREIEKERLERR